MLGRFVEAIYGLGALNIRCLPIGSFSSVFHFALILPQLLDLQARIVSSIMWLKTQPQFIMALWGGSWRLISMAKWCNYIYCSECDRPFLKTKRRIVTFRTTDNKSSAFSHCLYCGLSFASLSPTFWRNVSLPALGVSSVAFAIALSTNNPDAWAFGLLSAAPLFPFFRMRKRCKPIYDRWIEKHGSDPSGWNVISEA